MTVLKLRRPIGHGRFTWVCDGCGEEAVDAWLTTAMAEAAETEHWCPRPPFVHEFEFQDGTISIDEYGAIVDARHIPEEAR